VLFTTGYAQTGALDRELKGAPLLRKPFKLADLAQKMHALLHAAGRGANVLPMRPVG
jgi:hypothetical protein